MVLQMNHISLRIRDKSNPFGDWAKTNPLITKFNQWFEDKKAFFVEEIIDFLNKDDLLQKTVALPD